MDENATVRPTNNLKLPDHHLHHGWNKHSKPPSSQAYSRSTQVTMRKWAWLMKLEHDYASGWAGWAWYSPISSKLGPRFSRPWKNMSIIDLAAVFFFAIPLRRIFHLCPWTVNLIAIGVKSLWTSLPLGKRFWSVLCMPSKFRMKEGGHSWLFVQGLHELCHPHPLWMRLWIMWRKWWPSFTTVCSAAKAWDWATMAWLRAKEQSLEAVLKWTWSHPTPPQVRVQVEVKVIGPPDLTPCLA